MRATLKRKRIQQLVIFSAMLYIVSYCLREYALYRLRLEDERDDQAETTDLHRSPYPGIEEAKISGSDIERRPDNIDAGPLETVDFQFEPFVGADKHIYEPTAKENATLFSLVRNEDIHTMLKTIRNVEDRFNKDYHYDWVFANDKPFSPHFVEMARQFVTGHAYFVEIPKEMWSYPAWIDEKQAATVRTQMMRRKIKYGSSESYRHMCRFNGGFFYKLQEMKRYKYYWRVEPEVQFRCDINYDPFKMMREENKVYGFNLAPLELHTTVATLWPTVKSYMNLYPDEIAEDNNFLFLTDDDGKTFNMCHFWSNFEIADMDFFRGAAYQKFFDYLDKAGGIYYERWGDAPIHTIAVSILLSKDKLKFIPDTGYFHDPNGDCPLSFETRLNLGCECIPSTDFTWCTSSCIPKFFDIHNLPRPAGVPTRRYVPIHDSKLREVEEERLRKEEEDQTKIQDDDDSAVNEEEDEGGKK